MKLKTLVLGASIKRDRYSYMAVSNLLEHGHEVEAIGLQEGEIQGITVKTEKIMIKNIDTVTLYLNPIRQKEYYDYIIRLRPRRVIFNPGTENLDFYKILENNMIKVEIACTLVLLTTNQY